MNEKPPVPVNLLALMKRIEWAAHDRDGSPECPDCGRWHEETPHADNCEVAAAIRFLQWEEDETKALEAALAETSKRAQPIKQKGGDYHGEDQKDR